MEAINNQISILYRLSQVFINKKLKVYGLSHSQIATLLFLAQNEFANQHAITEHLSLDKGSVSSMIKKLEKNGYIRKLQDPSDKRATRLTLTYKSNLLLNQIREANHELTFGILDGFNNSEKKVISEYLERMKENVELINTPG